MLLYLNYFKTLLLDCALWSVQYLFKLTVAGEKWQKSPLSVCYYLTVLTISDMNCLNFITVIWDVQDALQRKYPGEIDNNRAMRLWRDQLIKSNTCTTWVQEVDISVDLKLIHWWDVFWQYGLIQGRPGIELGHVISLCYTESSSLDLHLTNEIVHEHRHGRGGRGNGDQEEQPFLPCSWNINPYPSSLNCRQ